MTPLLFVFAALLADPARPVDAPPAITPEVQIEFWRASAALAEMKPAWEEANADRQRAMEAIQRACGEKFQAQLEAKKLVCRPKPEPAKKGDATK